MIISRWVLSGLLVLSNGVDAAESIAIRILEGDGAINNIRLERAKEPVIQVETENGAPVAGAVVHYVLPTIGPGGLFADGSASATTVTDQDGRAHAPRFRPNRTAGQFQIQVTASHSGETASARITQTNAESSTGMRSSSKKIIFAILGGVAVGGAALAAKGGGKKSPSGAVSSGTIITAGTPSLGAP